MVLWKSFTFVMSIIEYNAKKKKNFDFEIQGQNQFCRR